VCVCHAPLFGYGGGGQDVVLGRIWESGGGEGEGLPRILAPEAICMDMDAPDSVSLLAVCLFMAVLRSIHPGFNSGPNLFSIRHWHKNDKP